MNLPNVLTVSRIFLTLIFLYCLDQTGRLAAVSAVVLFALASITDFYDGHLARKRAQISNFGKIMDPLADKFLILATFFVFSRMSLFPVWMFWLIFVREVAVTLARFWAMARGLILAAETSGKIKTALQMATIVVILLYLLLQEFTAGVSWPGPLLWLGRGLVASCIWLTLGLTIFSGLQFFWNNRRRLSRLGDEASSAREGSS